jgi:ligand-binding sensor domain-containing protein
VADDNTLWVGTWGGGLVHFDGTDWTIYNTSNSGLPDDYINDLSFDENQILWIGTLSHGLVAFDGTNWTVYDKNNSDLPNNGVKRVCITDNLVWAGTSKGLVSFDGTDWNVYTIENSDLPDNFIQGLDYDDGLLWISCNMGMASFDGADTWNVFNVSNSVLLSNDIRALVIDENGTKWMGSVSGLTVYNENGIPVHVQENLLNNGPLKIYPNPATDKILIENVNGSAVSEVTIYDLKGQKLFRRKGDVSRVSVSQLPNGLYLLEAVSENRHWTSKLIKQ